MSLRLKAELNRIAPAGTPRHFVVNTGAEAVENAIKSVLLNRVKTSGEADGGFIVSFEGAFHGRTLGSLAVTHRKKARLGFPTFDWPHVSFPAVDGSAKETARREERSLKQLWDLLVSGRLPHADKSKESFRREIDAIDDFLGGSGQELDAFVRAQREALSPETQRRSRRVAAVLVEPIQGEGGVRMASARFMRKLRLLTRIYDVPLMFDEVQTGWGATGRLWAHELFDLPCPPDVVIWAKKAQNGVLFVSEELATFFQEEKKFNTTWEGDSVGMVRLLALLDKLDLDEVRRTGARARAGLERLARDYSGFIKNVRGAGVMLAFDVVRADWRDALRDRAFRRGPRAAAGRRANAALLSALRHRALRDRGSALDPAARGRGRPARPHRASGVDRSRDPGRHARVSARGHRSGPAHSGQLRRAQGADHGGGVRALRRRLTVSARRAAARTAAPAAVPARDCSRRRSPTRARSASRCAIGCRGRSSATRSAARWRTTTRRASAPIRASAKDNTFYLHAMATLPSVRNQIEVENYLLDRLREEARGPGGYEYLSTLIEERVHHTGPEWLRSAVVLHVADNYLRSGIRFVYVQAGISDASAAA